MHTKSEFAFAYYWAGALATIAFAATVGGFVSAFAGRTEETFAAVVVLCGVTAIAAEAEKFFREEYP